MPLERACATAAHWSEEQYRQAIDRGNDAPERLVLVAEDDGEVQAIEVQNPALPPQTARRQGGGCVGGFLAARHAAREWELENIVVSPEFRGRGIGAELLSAWLTRVRARGSSSVFLEVRESNVAARRLYEKAGFRQTGRRKLYYSDPAEDAILYSQVVA